MEYYNNLDVNDPMMPNANSGFPKMKPIIDNEERKNFRFEKKFRHSKWNCKDTSDLLCLCYLYST